MVLFHRQPPDSEVQVARLLPLGGRSATEKGNQGEEFTKTPFDSF